MLENHIVIAAPTQQAAYKGREPLSKVMGGNLTPELLVHEHDAVFLRKEQQNLTRLPASVVQPFGRCDFNEQGVRQVVQAHGLELLFCGSTNGKRTRAVSIADKAIRRDNMIFFFDVWPAEKDKLEAEGGALLAFSKRVGRAMENVSLLPSHDLIAVVRRASSDHYERYSVSLSMLVGLEMEVWPSVIAALWSASVMHPSLMHFSWMTQEHQVPSVFVR